MKRVTALIMSLFLIVATGVNAYATGAEGAILGGLSGGSLAGLGLTGPEVALAVAALFGVAYAVDNADTIYTEMNNCINKAVDGVQDGAAVVADWWDKACTGIIDTTSSVWSGICDWFTGTRDNYYNAVRAIDCPAGTVYKILNNSYSCDSDTIAVPYFMIGQSGKYKDVHVGVSFWSDTRFKGSYGNGDFTCEYDSDSGLYYKLCEHALQTDDETSALKQLSNNNIPQYGDLSFCYEGTYVKSKLMSYLRTLVSVKFDGATATADSVLTGGIDKVLDNDLIDSPADVIFPDTIVLNPDAVSGNGLEQILEKVIAGEMTWTDYWEAVTSTSLPAVKSGDAVYELDNEGVSEKEADLNTDGSSSSLDDYKVDLKKIFPFCIPFDIYDLLNCLCAEPEAPKFTWTIPLSAVGLKDCSIEIDLKTWDSVAQIFRNMELLAFCIGLAFVTRNLIKG